LALPSFPPPWSLRVLCCLHPSSRIIGCRHRGSFPFAGDLLHPSPPPKDKQLPPAATAAMVQPPTKWWRNAIWLVPSRNATDRLLSPRGFDPVAANGRGGGKADPH
jgi:hypothetical protein